jgi:nucleoside-diphosphate-sugar epimerase
MAEKWLLTGASGFIGTNVAELCLQHGHSFLNLDIKPPRIESHKPFWRNVDVRSGDDVMRCAQEFNPDRIVHLASDPDVNIKTIQEFTTTIDGTRNLAAVANAVPDLKRFVHISTQFVVKPGVEPESERFLQPYTMYGEAKALSEGIVWKTNLAQPWFIIRPTIIWGPYHPTFAQQIFRHIRNRTYLYPKGREPIVRAFGYVRNTAEQIYSLAELPTDATNKRVFYVGDASINYDIWADAFSVGLTGRPAHRIPVWALSAMGWAGDKLKKIGLPSPIDSGRAFRMSTSSKIDLSATHSLVGMPKVSFEEGVEETLQWLKPL